MSKPHDLYQTFCSVYWPGAKLGTEVLAITYPFLGPRLRTLIDGIHLAKYSGLVTEPGHKFDIIIDKT